MEKMLSKKVADQRNKMSYRNFNASVYCTVWEVSRMTDLEEFDRQFKLLSDHVKLGRAYVECFRGMKWCSKEQLLKVKAYFEAKGIATSGGITTCAESMEDGFNSLCYSTEEGVEVIRKAVALNAEVFDEFIFDDFYFFNCRCAACIEKKGNKSWSEYRIERKRYITEEIVMKTAKEINPDINVIIKYPQWYEVYQETGYDPIVEPALFDSIYTGTETRNPEYAQQHLPKYLSYFVMRYLESAAPSRNLGGWFDPYECSYNLTSYLEQGYLTIFAKAKEVTLFCLGSLLFEKEFHSFPAAIGELFEEVDEYADQLGNPIGVTAYHPAYARGEDNLHNYLGMCGVPFEPTMQYPDQAKVVFLTEGASYDQDIVEKMKKSMMNGTDVVVTSGFIRRMGETFCHEFMNVSYSARKALVDEYADTKDNGLSVSGRYKGDRKILIPQLDYCTNDVWELAAAYGNHNNFPIVIRARYANAYLSIITIPDNMGDLYFYPREVLRVIRGVLMKGLPVQLEGPAGAQLFLYDNNKLILRSDLAYYETMSLHFTQNVKEASEISRGAKLEVRDDKISAQLSPGANYIVSYQ